MTNRIRVSDELDRALDNVTDIHRQMRYLALAHHIEPVPADLGDYKMLLDDLAASVQIIADELPAPTDPAPASAQHLADTDFPSP
ncbi:MAG: hypothetical protein JWN00_2714 [Actinomycetia bacterium]|nr:hypothetical protein [Actinomycetes bacterium]